MKRNNKNALAVRRSAVEKKHSDKLTGRVRAAIRICKLLHSEVFHPYIKLQQLLTNTPEE